MDAIIWHDAEVRDVMPEAGAADEPSLEQLQRQIGEDRRKMLRFLYDQEEPVTVRSIEEYAEAPRGSRSNNLAWLQGEIEKEWWPDELGPLIEIVGSTGSRGTRLIEITENGRHVVDTLRETGEIHTDEDFENLRAGYEYLRNEVERLGKELETHEDRLSLLGDADERRTDRIEALEEEVKEVDEKLEHYLEQIVDLLEDEKTTH